MTTEKTQTARLRRENLRLMDQLVKCLAIVALKNYLSRAELLELVEKSYDEHND